MRNGNDGVEFSEMAERRPRKSAQDNPDDTLAKIDKNQAKRIFARRLQSAYAAKGWNQSDLAREASKYLPPGKEIGRDNISNYVRGKHLPGAAILKALADCLGMDPADLLPARGASSKADVAPPFDIRDMGDGHVFLRVNRRVSWKTGAEIMRLLEGEK